MLGRLVDANRLNVQLLAAVPALVLLAAGSRLAVFALYSLRARALGRQTPRSARAAHAHGHDLLLRMERCILLAPAAAAAPGPRAGRCSARDGAAALCGRLLACRTRVPRSGPRACL